MIFASGTAVKIKKKLIIPLIVPNYSFQIQFF